MSVTRNIVSVSAITASQSLQLITDDGREIAIKVNLCKITLDDVNQLVYLYDASQSNIAKGVDVYEPNYYVLNFNDITSPVEDNANDLYTTILGYLAEAGGGGSDPATGDNQLTEIARLTSILDQLEYLNDNVTYQAPNWNLTQLRNMIDLQFGTRFQLQYIRTHPITAASPTALQTALDAYLASVNFQGYSISYVHSVADGYTAFVNYSIV